METVYVKVKIVIPDGEDVHEVLSEMDYTFEYNGLPLVTEILDQVN
jgi:hypothetical protein